MLYYSSSESCLGETESHTSHEQVLHSVHSNCTYSLIAHAHTNDMAFAMPCHRFYGDDNGNNIVQQIGKSRMPFCFVFFL